MKCKTAPHKKNIEKETESKTEIVETENPVPQLYPDIIA